jgi:hypothetical protein
VAASRLISSIPPPIFEVPMNRETTIWRYMDFTKFVSMVSKNALYFCRSDRLGDPFEGSIPKMNASARMQQLAEGKSPEEAAEIMSNILRWSRQWTFVNRWHMNEVESAAMWKLYSKSEEAVAIKSTLGRLDDCAGGKCQIGMVKYVDYEKESIPEGSMFYPYVHKRRSFEHEKELRAFIQEFPKKDGALDFEAEQNQDGRWFEVNLGHLITTVLVSPTAPAWFKSLVQDVCVKYNFRKEVKQSSISGVPLF